LKFNFPLIFETQNAIIYYVYFLEKNPDEIHWSWLSSNPSIFEIDYEALKERCAIYKEELIQKAMHPSRIQKYLDMGISIDELDNCI